MQGGDRGLGGFPTQNPVYVTATVSFDGLTWENVGVRFKGNSSLRAAWSSNSDRFPMRLDFDEFEEDHPEIKNKRFYGFKQLSLSTNLGDATHMRETLFYDLLEEAEGGRVRGWLGEVERAERQIDRAPRRSGEQGRPLRPVVQSVGRAIHHDAEGGRKEEDERDGTDQHHAPPAVVAEISPGEIEHVVHPSSRTSMWRSKRETSSLS